MSAFLKASLILLTVAAALLPALAILLTNTGHSPDFTWRTQWVIANLSVPILIALVCIVIGSVGYARHGDTPKRAQKIWLVGTAVVLLALALGVIFVGPIQRQIAGWNPNWPPEDWREARDALYFAYALLVAFLAVASLLFSWACFGVRKERIVPSHIEETVTPHSTG
jgi:hypothetical protein